MPVYWSMTTRWSVSIPASAATVADNLRGAIEHETASGFVTDTGFELRSFPRRRGRNSWKPRLVGVFAPEANGTRVDVVASAHPAVRVFTFVHSLLLFGIAWLMGTFAFSSEIPRAKVVLEALLRGKPIPPA